MCCRLSCSFRDDMVGRRSSLSPALHARRYASVRRCFRQKTRRYSWVYVRQYCAEIDEAARNRMELIVPELVKRNGVTEQLKAENQMEWVRQMNACKAQAEEVVKFELIYD